MRYNLVVVNLRFLIIREPNAFCIRETKRIIKKKKSVKWPNSGYIAYYTLKSIYSL